MAPSRTRRAAASLAAGLALSLLVAGCGQKDTLRRADADASPRPAVTASGDPTTEGAGESRAPDTDDQSQQGDGGEFAVGDPGKLKPPLLTADVLVTSTKTIPDDVRKAVADLDGVAAVLPLSLASLSANGRTLTLAAADPGAFRRFTPIQSAQADAVWKRVAGGEVAVDPALPRKLEDPKGYLRLGSSEKDPDVHIGAYAPLVKQISAVVNDKRGEQIGMTPRNALLISTGKLTPSALSKQLKQAVGGGVTMQTLAMEFDNPSQTAILSTSSVTSKVGTFTYTPRPNGTVVPQASWVKDYIRTEQVPILGSVTCNKGMLPQLRAALSEIVQRGLADKIHPGEYAGCYYPRFIANDPGKGLSLHSWGIAVDLNVPGNQRGTVGEMDRTVVSIFKRWGFAWGGDWNYTDPMHFEMARVVEVR